MPVDPQRPEAQDSRYADEESIRRLGGEKLVREYRLEMDTLYNDFEFRERMEHDA